MADEHIAEHIPTEGLTTKHIYEYEIVEDVFGVAQILEVLSSTTTFCLS